MKKKKMRKSKLSKKVTITSIVKPLKKLAAFYKYHKRRKETFILVLFAICHA